MHANVTRMLEVQFVDEHGKHIRKSTLYQAFHRK
jgi:hypothetical protein